MILLCDDNDDDNDDGDDEIQIFLFKIRNLHQV